MRVLLLCDDYWHPGNVVIEGISPLKQNGFAFDIISNANDFSPEMLSQYPVVLISKMDDISQADRQPWKTEAIQKAFIDYVENGGGLVAVHSGVVPGKNTTMLDHLVGCRFLGHPNASPVTVQPLKPHPVTEGVSLFREPDEHYKIEIITDDADILLASYSPAQGDETKYQEDSYYNAPEAIHTAGYVRNQGKGRVCALTPGHTLEVWHNVQFQRLLANALEWAGIHNHNVE
ncbi:MAG: ThuA domain-containing protein [Treponema sp.]|nr:ThuA domain-containing protein [Treponema sp.]